MQKTKVMVTKRPGENYIRIRARQTMQLICEGTVLVGYCMAGEEWPEDKSIKVPVPEAVTRIDNGAFRNCHVLEGVHFETCSYQMGANVFAGCGRLKTAFFAEGMEKVPMSTFENCTSLRQVRLPRSVRRINMNAFKNCTSLKRIDLPEKLEVIELYAFWGCRSLQEIRLPEGLGKLGEYAFANCTGLKTAILPGTLETLEDCMFQNCIALEECIIPTGIRELGLAVFAFCRSLRRVVLPETLKSVHPYAFYRCENLEIVEGGGLSEFEEALWDTPFWKRFWIGYPERVRLPMELLHSFAGEISGQMLSAMGYCAIDVDKHYCFFLTDTPGVISAHVRYPDDDNPRVFREEQIRMNTRLEPFPGGNISRMQKMMDKWSAMLEEEEDCFD